jgi:outer membrane protein
MKFAVALGCLAVVGSLAAMPAQAQSVKIGYVDLQQALSETGEGKAIKAKLERLLKDKQREFDKMQDEVKRIKDEIETQGAMMKEDLRRTKMQDYQKKMVELQEFYMGNQKELADEEAKLTKPLLDRFEKVLQVIGKDEGYTLILPSAAVVYGQPSLDLTSRLVQKINSGAGK